MSGLLRSLAIASLTVSVVLPSIQTPREGANARPAVGTAALSGVVVNDVTGRPVRRAAVTISSAASNVRQAAVTDETGTFSFENLPADRYFLSASRAGFVTATYGAKRPNRPGTTVALDDGRARTDVTLRMTPGAVITGTVRDAAGEPLPGARVIVLRQTFGYDTGERTLAPAAGGPGQQTDDRGVYRIFGLSADDYFVVVAAGSMIRNASELRETTAAEVDWATRLIHPPGGTPVVTTAPAPAPAEGAAVEYAPVFYPGVFTQAAATAITLKEGEERAGADVMVDWTHTAKISGRVVSAGGALPPGLQVVVVAHDTIPGVPFSGFGNARVAADGTFASAGLPPGDYTVAVRVGNAPGRGAASPTSAALFGTATVTVNGADVSTTVALQTGVTVAGRLVFAGTSIKPPSDLSSVRVSLTGVRSHIPTLGVPAGSADATGAFAFNGVTPGRYRISASASGGWQMQSAMSQGRDIADFPLDINGNDVRDVDITFTDRPTEISGDLLDSDGRPATEYFIIVFPADKAYWTPQSREDSVRPSRHRRPLPRGESAARRVPTLAP